MRPSPAADHRVPWAPALVVLLSLLVIALVVPCAAAPAAGVHGPRTMAQPYASYDTGRVDVIFPSALPNVQLRDSTNASIGAGLSVDQILEVTPGPSPQVVAVAFPSQLSSFNASASGGGPALPFGLTATLQALPADAALWAGPDATVSPNGPPIGVARLAINFSLDPALTPSDGVGIVWTVTGWPWHASSDLLGIQLGLTTQAGRGFTACSGPLPATPVDCAGAPLSPGSTVWGPSFGGVEGDTASGPTALVSWAPTVAVASGVGGAVTVGALGQAADYGHLFLGGTAGGSPSVAGSIDFALVNPLPATVPLVLHGEVGWFAGSAVGFAAVGTAALFAYRRRNRSIESNL